VALYDLDGTAIGAADVTGSLAVLTSVGEPLVGGSAVSGPGTLNHYIVDPIVGAANVSASTQAVFNMSGFVVGGSALIDARLMDVSGISLGTAIVSGDLLRILAVGGYLQGGSVVALSYPEPIYGVAIVTGYMEVIHVPLPVCEIPPVSTSFRWGHTFGVGDLDICIVGVGGNPIGPVCVSYTLYQVQRGCTLRQVGQSGRRPVQTSVGCYYATGTAGECGQPGLWAIRWKYQRTFSDPMVEKTCYFTVLDAVLSPVPGDTLERVCKYGWD
jgi:hypothetical protein